MAKNKKVVKNALIVGLLLMSIMHVVLPSISAQDTNQAVSAQDANQGRNKLLTFPSYILLNYDDSPLKKPLIIDQSVSVPFEIKYYHEVPESLYKLVPGSLLRNTIFFGSAIQPQVQIKLEIIDGPDWANIYFTQPDLIFQIPTPGVKVDDIQPQKTKLIISPYREAPAKPVSIKIKATAAAVGRVEAAERTTEVPFTPSYIPLIDVKVDNPVREVSPRESVSIGITIKNNANKHTIVKLSTDAPGNWAPVLSPSEIELAPSETYVATFSVKAPYGLGWHDKTTSMKVICKPLPSPLSDMENYSKYEIAEQVAFVQLTNYGFSLSGIEPFLGVTAIIIILVAIVLMYMKKQKK